MKTYECIHIELDMQNHYKDKICIYNLKVNYEPELHYTDNPVCEKIDNLELWHITSGLPDDCELNEFIIIPPLLKNYILEFIVSDNNDANFFKFFKTLESEYRNTFDHLLNKSEPTIKSFDKFINAYSNVTKLYKQIFIHLYSRNESLGKPLLHYSDNFDELFEKYK